MKMLIDCAKSREVSLFGEAGRQTTYQEDKHADLYVNYEPTYQVHHVIMTYNLSSISSVTTYYVKNLTEELMMLKILLVRYVGGVSNKREFWQCEELLMRL